MEILNPGNILPVYLLTNSQMANRAGCEEFNWAIPVPIGEDITFEFPVAAGGNGTWDWAAVNADTGVEVALDATLLKYSENFGGDAWVAYYGDGGLSLLLAAADPGCITWYFRFFTTSGTVYYSERWRSVDLHVNKNIYKLSFSHSDDIDGILYTAGYAQKVWLLDAIFDVPEIRESTEKVPDGNAIEVLTFQSLQRRVVLRFPYFPDFWQGVFHRLRMHDTITLIRIETGEEFNLADKTIEFSTDAQDVCFKVGILSWQASVQVMTGCEESQTFFIKNNLILG